MVAAGINHDAMEYFRIGKNPPPGRCNFAFGLHLTGI